MVTNGRILGPLEPKEELTINDLDLLEKLTMAHYGDKMVQAFHTHMDVMKPDVSDQAMLVAGILMGRPQGKARQEITFWKDKHSMFEVPPQHPDRPAFDVVAVMDPVLRGAQKTAPLLQVLGQVLNARI